MLGRIAINHQQGAVITGIKIAATCVTSQRVLELATRQAYGLTPRRWLKLTRFNAAYCDLLRGNSRSVTQACQHWQLNHLGRFDIEYRQLFGESPGDTLARAQFR